MKGNEQKPGNHGFHASRLHFYEVTFQCETEGSNFVLSKSGLNNEEWSERVNSNKGNLIKLEI